MTHDTSAPTRTDRQPDQLRPVTIRRGYTVHAEGSVLIEFGQTQVGEQAPWRSAWFWFERSAPA